MKRTTASRRSKRRVSGKGVAAKGKTFRVNGKCYRRVVHRKGTRKHPASPRVGAKRIPCSKVKRKAPKRRAPKRKPTSKCRAAVKKVATACKCGGRR